MKILSKNKFANFHYEILEKYEAGIMLSGPEVKAVKNGQISLKGSYVSIDPKNEVWLINSYILPYQPAKSQQANYDPARPKKLLLNKKEINALIGKGKQKGLTIIPLAVYTKKRLIKVEIALVKGKSKIDKRATIKKREVNREIQRTLKSS